MVFNFTRYTEWLHETKKSDFTIGIIGDDNVFNTLKVWYEGKPKGTKKYQIKKLSSPEQYATCHVVYVGESKRTDLNTIRNVTAANLFLSLPVGTDPVIKGAVSISSLLMGN